MKDNYTHIVMVLDRSGSMQSIKNDVIGGFNQFLEDQKKVDGQASLTLAQFDDVYEVLEDFTDLQKAKSLNENTYVPRSMTALYDAIGKTINVVGNKLSDMKESDRPNKIIFVVITDGFENASQEFKQSQIQDMVQHQQDNYNWDFVFLAANQDAVLTGKAMNFSDQSSMTYTAGPIGTQNTYKSLSKNVTRSRVTGQSVNFSTEDRSLATEK